MRFRIALFAYHRERHGDFVEVDCEPQVAAVLDALEARGIAAAKCRLAVNAEIVNSDAAIPGGAEVALIPPVSGG